MISADTGHLPEKSAVDTYGVKRDWIIYVNEILAIKNNNLTLWIVKYPNAPARKPDVG